MIVHPAPSIAYCFVERRRPRVVAGEARAPVEPAAGAAPKPPLTEEELRVLARACYVRGHGRLGL